MEDNYPLIGHMLAFEGCLETAAGAEFGSQIVDRGQMIRTYNANCGKTALDTN